MRRIVMIFIMSLFLISVFGCGAVKTKPVETGFNKGFEMVEDKDVGKVYLAPGFDFKGYDILLISDPSTLHVLPKKGIDPEEMKIVFKNHLIKSMKETGICSTVTDDFSVLSSNKMSPPKALVMNSVFTELNPGNRALRYFVGFGAGSTKVQVETEMRDYQSNIVYFKASDRRSGVMGTFGGDSKGFILESLAKIAEKHASFVKRIASGGKIEKAVVGEDVKFEE